MSKDEAKFSYEPNLSLYIHGELDLVVDVSEANVNPFCFAYSIEPNVEAWIPPSPLATLPDVSKLLPISKLSKRAGLLADDQANMLNELSELAGQIEKHSQMLERFWGRCSSDSPAGAHKGQEQLLLTEDLSVTSDGIPTWYANAREKLEHARAGIAATRGTDTTAIKELLKTTAEAVVSVADSIRLAHRLPDRIPHFQQLYPTGKAVTVRVKRRALIRGQLEKDAPEVTFEGPTFKTLSPIGLDVGVGPAITFKRKANYEYVSVSGASGPELRVARTMSDLNIDGVVTFSPYIYGARWLDEERAAWRFLLPRPVIGLSLNQPLSSIYVGAQIDPYQFLDLSFGYRWFSQTKLINQSEGDLALAKSDGTVLPIAKKSELTGSFFVSVTASTDLFTRWISKL